LNTVVSNPLFDIQSVDEEFYELLWVIGMAGGERIFYSGNLFVGKVSLISKSTSVQRIGR